MNIFHAVLAYNRCGMTLPDIHSISRNKKFDNVFHAGIGSWVYGSPTSKNITKGVEKNSQCGMIEARIDRPGQ
jgi:hypothetical protein